MIKVLLTGNNSKYLKDALSLYGYDVYTTNSIMQLLKILKNISVDIILLDDIMPNVDGLQTLKTVREINKFIPVIMISPYNDDKKMVTCLKNGADDYIIKPFVLPNLLARMEAVLRRTYYQLKFKPSKKISLPPLTTKEKQVLELASKGSSNKEIADRLYVKEVTIKTHLNRIFKKLKVTNRTQAVLMAAQIINTGI